MAEPLPRRRLLAQQVHDLVGPRPRRFLDSPVHLPCPLSPAAPDLAEDPAATLDLLLVTERVVDRVALRAVRAGLRVALAVRLPPRQVQPVDRLRARLH